MIEWDKKIGKFSASMAGNAFARTKTGWGASRDAYIARLVMERLNKQRVETYTSREMQIGLDREPFARSAYSFYRDVDVAETGWVPHPTIAMSGCSPDGLVGDDGLAEFKCPSAHTHLTTLLGGAVKQDYVLQCRWQMVCTGRSWCDLVSFNPEFPERMQLHVTRIGAIEIAHKKMEKDVIEFLAEVDFAYQQLLLLYPERAAA